MKERKEGEKTCRGLHDWSGKLLRFKYNKALNKQKAILHCVCKVINDNIQLSCLLCWAVFKILNAWCRLATAEEKRQDIILCEQWSEFSRSAKWNILRTVYLYFWYLSSFLLYSSQAERLLFVFVSYLADTQVYCLLEGCRCHFSCALLSLLLFSSVAQDKY